MKSRTVVRVLKIGAIGIAAVAIAGFVVMSLWNWLAPTVLGARTIDFWQALGILVLSKLLFGGFRGRGCHGIRWQRRMSDRWEQMNPEERERFRQGMARRCGASVATQESGKTI
jgi:hypothetical protein